jgi:Ca2+-transporting ATPase
MDDKDTSRVFYNLSTDEVSKKLNTNNEGLTSEEADKRLEDYGPNKLQEEKKRSLLDLFFDQVNNPIIYLLLGAVIISFIFNDIPEAIAIIIVILLNTIIGFWMEYQAQSSVEALKKLDKLQADVKRNGKREEINAENLVPGDIILLEAGDLVPADARVIKASELKIDESPLTGESVDVEKGTEKITGNPELADQTNMIFKATAVTAGKGEAIVTATGMDTEIGKISEMVNKESGDEIPLNRKLQKLSHRLIYATMGMAALFFIFGWISGKEIYLLLQTSIAWTVAAIPEGLPIVASIALARGMLRLSKKNVLVKKLAAVETLGETTVIFTDKTGTLTENKLTVSRIVYPGNETDVSGFSEDDKVSKKLSNSEEDSNLHHFLKISAYCNDVQIKDQKDLEGDELDIGLIEFMQATVPGFLEDKRSRNRIHEDPFDSESKFMSTISRENGRLYIAMKGAAEPVLNRSGAYLEDSKKKEIDDNFRKEWLKKNDELSGQGFKVIAYAYRIEDSSMEKELKDQEDFSEDMIFSGLVCFIDPARRDVEDALKICHQAGIEVVMVTGDHPGTARNIAEKINLDEENEIDIMKGREIEEQPGQVYSSNLFARVDPKQKHEIVEHFKEKGEITAMTGDGVNDAPALKKADIGIAMGKRGTQIAQDVADMILKDDSFPSIVYAIQEGRIIFGNIRKFIVYQLSYHLAEIIIIAGISFTLFQIPLLPLQLLFLNLLSDVFPALALGLGKGDEYVMHKKPKDPDEPIINKKNWIAMAVYGVIMAVIITGVFLFAQFYLEESKEVARTIAFFSLAVSQLLHVFNMREPGERVFSNQVTRNPYIWMALGICIVALVAGYFIPVLKETLSFETLSSLQWLIAFGGSIATLIVIQGVKGVFKI